MNLAMWSLFRERGRNEPCMKTRCQARFLCRLVFAPCAPPVSFFSPCPVFKGSHVVCVAYLINMFAVVQVSALEDWFCRSEWCFYSFSWVWQTFRSVATMGRCAWDDSLGCWMRTCRRAVVIVCRWRSGVCIHGPAGTRASGGGCLGGGLWMVQMAAFDGNRLMTTSLRKSITNMPISEKRLAW